MRPAAALIVSLLAGCVLPVVQIGLSSLVPMSIVRENGGVLAMFFILFGLLPVAVGVAFARIRLPMACALPGIFAGEVICVITWEATHPTQHDMWSNQINVFWYIGCFIAGLLYVVLAAVGFGVVRGIAFLNRRQLSQ